MLTLTRKEGQAVLIVNNVRVIVTAIDGRTIKLSFEAPDDIKILREEISQKPDFS